ncbi:MAG: serine/threonine protein kinase [Maritimibacter sp.]
MSYLPYASSSLSGWFAATGSSIVAHGLVIGLSFGGIQSLLDLAVAKPEDPGFTITLERLDSDTIAGLLEQEGVAGSEEEGAAEGDEPQPETPAEEPEDIAALAPEPTPDSEEEPVPDAEPEPEPEPEVSAEPDIPEDMVAEPVENISAGLVPEPVTPLSPLIGTAPTATGSSPLTPQTLTPIKPAAGEIQVVSARPSLPAATPRPAATPAPPPSAQDLAIGALIERIRAAPADPCLLTLPRRDGEEGVGLALIASTDRAMADFVETVLTEPEDANIRQTRTLIDQRQCPAMTYVRQNRDYPATRLGVRLDSAEVPSSGNLTGVLRGTGGRYVMLLLVDNNGVVQDLARFVSYSGNFARFDVPVTRVGALRDTSQVLLAIATDRPSSVIRDRAGQLAQDVFAGLEGEIASSAALAVTVFDVR